MYSIVHTSRVESSLVESAVAQTHCQGFALICFALLCVAPSRTYHTYRAAESCFVRSSAVLPETKNKTKRDTRHSPCQSFSYSHPPPPSHRGSFQSRVTGTGMVQQRPRRTPRRAFIGRFKVTRGTREGDREGGGGGRRRGKAKCKGKGKGKGKQGGLSSSNAPRPAFFEKVPLFTFLGAGRYSIVVQGF